ncbi:MAG: endonuclease domain-containing protein [Gammaproteobacteria bacterium]|nr:endonuclease domain-containing protein [Gammaproteobacteria bacterium]
MKLHNRNHLKPLRRALRAHLTPAEACLWKYLQRGQLAGRKFRRQHSIGPYVVDFYCPAESLIIELDGAAHDGEQAWAHDEQRTAFLTTQGLRVVRFENRDVLENLEGVLAAIRQQFVL